MTRLAGAFSSAHTQSRWVASGHSSDRDAYSAGRAAARAALRQADPKLLVVFSSDSYDLPALLRGINDVAGGAPLIGCSTAGEIASDGPTDASVVVLAMGGPGLSVAAGVGRDASSRLREAASEAATCVRDLPNRPHRILMLLTDGLGGDQMEVVRGAYAEVGAEIPLVGGCAGDDLKMKRTYQLYGNEVLGDAIVAAAVASEAPMGIGVRHGWRRVGEPMLVTSSGGNVVATLDDQPALDVYLRRLNAPDVARHDPEAFTRFALTHPLGISRRSGEEVRFVAEADFDTRSLICIAHVPQGGLAWIMEGDDRSVLEATDLACQDALEPLHGKPPLGVIAFDCIARRGVLGEQGIHREIDRIAQHTDGAAVAGFYTYGEIARTRGMTGFHNQTLVVLAIG